MSNPDALILGAHAAMGPHFENMREKLEHTMLAFREVQCRAM